MVQRQRRDFLLGGAVEDESLSRWRNAIHQSAAIRTCNQIALRIQGQRANMRLIALEKNRMLALGSDLVNLAAISGGDVENPGFVESEIPYVFRAGRKVLRGTPG